MLLLDLSPSVWPWGSSPPATGGGDSVSVRAAAERLGVTRRDGPGIVGHDIVAGWGAGSGTAAGGVPHHDTEAGRDAGRGHREGASLRLMGRQRQWEDPVGSIEAAEARRVLSPVTVEQAILEVREVVLLGWMEEPPLLSSSQVRAPPLEPPLPLLPLFSPWEPAPPSSDLQASTPRQTWASERDRSSTWAVRNSVAMDEEGALSDAASAGAGEAGSSPVNPAAVVTDDVDTL